MKEDKNDILYITHRGELLIWLIVILFFVSIYTIINFYNEKIDNDYTLFLPDVDGLIVGSPVRMMGIEVGYITKIEPTNEEVYVNFLITDSELKIPRGTQATVEFSGMAGSKSLELYLPDKNTYIDNTTPILTVNPPKRLHDAFGLLNDMFDKIGAIIQTSSSFGNKIKTISNTTGLPTRSEEDINEFMKYTNKLVDDANKKADDLGRKLEKNGKK